MANFQTIQTSTRTIDDFKSRLNGGGARPNLFEVELYFPTLSDTTDFSTATADANENGGNSTDGDGAGRLTEDIRFLVKGAQLPSSNITPIEVPFRGRTLKIAGDRTFDTWTVTVINDTDFNVRDAFERWMSFISKHDSTAGNTQATQYQRNAIVHQLGIPNVTQPRDTYSEKERADLDYETNIPILRSYQFYGVFPTNISAIDLSYDTTDTIEEFTVELQVQYWKAYSKQGNLRID